MSSPRRSVVALVTGFTKLEVLTQISFEQLRKLKREGIIDRIVYVTWDSARIDPLLSPLAAMADVEVVRIPEPQLTGFPLQKGVCYQIRNLAAGLDLIADDETLVLKTRPDFVFANTEFLKRKILDFDTLCAPSTLGERLHLDVPPAEFRRKIWLPWASAGEPLFYSDAAFLGLKCDIAKLADRGAERFLHVLGDERCDRITHMSRFLNVFVGTYPIFARYGENVRYFNKVLDYRDYFAFLCGQQPFFWRLAVLNAWILSTHFHVDAGRNQDVLFCSTHGNPGGKIARLGDLKFEPPLDKVEAWRAAMPPGELRQCVKMSVANLMTDDWQHQLFERERQKDATRGEILSHLQQAVAYDPAQLGQMETAFYAAADAYFERYFTEHPPVRMADGTINLAK